jgi:hypothetical protein
MGYITLNTALRWFQTKASDIEEYDEYRHMVKKVRFASIYHKPSVEFLFSLGKGPIVLERMTRRSSRASSLIG